MTFLGKTSRICPNCGMSVAEGNKYCDECGALYTGPEPGAGEAKRYCPNGHAVTDVGYNFCVICSAKLVDTPPAPPAPSASDDGWTCIHCCAVNLDMAANFCTACGQPRDRKAEDARAKEVTVDVRHDYRPATTDGDEKPVAGGMSVPPVYSSEAWFPGDDGPTIGAVPPAALFREAATPAREDVVIPPTRAREIPDIPDIMKPLTNNDMKR